MNPTPREVKKGGRDLLQPQTSHVEGNLWKGKAQAELGGINGNSLHWVEMTEGRMTCCR